MSSPSIPHERRCICCTETEAAAWINDTAEAALDGDEDMIRLLPDVCDHFLGYSIVHLPPASSPRPIIEALDGEVEP